MNQRPRECVLLYGEAALIINEKLDDKITKFRYIACQVPIGPRGQDIRSLECNEI